MYGTVQCWKHPLNNRAACSAKGTITTTLHIFPQIHLHLHGSTRAGFLETESIRGWIERHWKTPTQPTPSFSKCSSRVPDAFRQ